MAEINRFKLEWACRRGMRELDKMIMPFYQNHFDSLTEAQQQAFAEMLTYPDPELFRWVMHQLPAPTPAITAIIELMREKIYQRVESMAVYLYEHSLFRIYKRSNFPKILQH